MMFNRFQWVRSAAIFSAVVGTLLSVNVSADENNDWESLIAGDSLNSWEQMGGNSIFSLEGGVITGTPKSGEPNSFLTTKKHYSDFILEYEVFIDADFNSGVQIRSQSKKSYQDGRVFGYQVEIDPTSRAYSGGIFDEGRRKWLYPLSLNEKSRKAFRIGKWNKFHVEAVGNSIKTWINGVMCANLVDDMDAAGFIALQIHSIHEPELENARVKWRNIRIKTKNLSESLLPVDTSIREISYLQNRLTVWEKRVGFRLLWDGKTSNGWRGAKLTDFPKSGWQMKEGVLTVLASDGGESTGPGDIVTLDKFSSFELELEFRMTKGANSGIKYFVDPELNKGEGSAIGLEFQILDDVLHPDAKLGVAGNRTLGSAYDLIAAADLANPNSKKANLFKGVDTWNKARIVVRGGQVEHWLNDHKVVEFDRYSQIFDALVKYSKYANWDNFGRLPSGNILLQDHGNTVSFRSIKIREILN